MSWRPSSHGGVVLTWRILEGPRVNVKEIVFTGNASVTDSELRNFMLSKSNPRLWFITTGSEPFVERKLREDLERIKLYYQLEGWLVSRGASVNGGEVARLGHVSNVSIPGHAGDELVAALDLLGVAVSSGSACSAGTTEPSKIISAMLGVERARGAVRISLGDATTGQDVALALQAFERVLRA